MNIKNEDHLKVPDAFALSAVQALCDIRDPYKEGQDELFLRAMHQNIRWHDRRSDFYRKFLDHRNFSHLQQSSSLENIPYLPANFFKKYEILSISRRDVTTHLTSSGTLGQKSQMFFDDWSLSIAQRMVADIFYHNSWMSWKETNYLLLTYESAENLKLGTSFTDYFLCRFAPIKSLFCALRANGEGGHQFDLMGSIDQLKGYDSSLPLRLFGFPSFLYFILNRMKKINLKLAFKNPESLVFLGGGWKGHADQAISKSELYDLIQDRLGINPNRIRDGFGSVEHCIPYIECINHHFHVPTWSRVLIRDLKTLEVLPQGEKGFLQLISPYITSVSANSVLMTDLAAWYGPEECGCEIKTPWFEVSGRATLSQNKSCAVTASELLKGVSA